MIIEVLIELVGEILTTVALTSDNEKRNKGCLIIAFIIIVLIIAGIGAYYYLTATE
tara:strand:- start:7595 stop:7762 length:168 start_codon:yes stop_codon:yes gene_type:complete